MNIEGQPINHLLKFDFERKFLQLYYIYYKITNSLPYKYVSSF